MEEKYGPRTARRTHDDTWNEAKEEYSDASTDSEEEDDEGILVSKAVDAQIQNTLEAIRKKDPRVYDKNITFFSGLDEEPKDTIDPNSKPPKPMFLSDYHRRNLLHEGDTEDHQGPIQPTYSQQQDYMKNILVKEMHATADNANDINGESTTGEDEFLVARSTKKSATIQESRSRRSTTELDIQNADKDPETYLSNFMSGRAWVPNHGSRFQPFESDDEEEDQKAEDFEAAYNSRFENPAKSNEKLMSHARDAAARHSVRKEKANTRKKTREAERAKKEIAKLTREQERARLRKLKVGEAEEKIQKIKEAAGVRGDVFDQQDWSAFLNEGWDDSKWEEEMKKRFGDDYYADHDCDEEAQGKSRKPEWEEDIDINDLLPDFDASDEANLRQLNGSDTEAEKGSQNQDTRSTERNRSKEHEEKKKVARQERRKIERLVDEQMHVDEKLSTFSKKHAGNFRYRETSPVAFGLTAQDILLASDSQLNQYAGLKKMAAFRDSDKKRKDRRHLGKKARLRQWRKDTFGDEHGPNQTVAEVPRGNEPNDKFLRAQRRLGKGKDIDQGMFRRKPR